jgi:hypothetical protein
VDGASPPPDDVTVYTDSSLRKRYRQSKIMTILLVEDESSLLRFMAAIEQTAGFDVLLADGGDEPPAICESDPHCIDLGADTSMSYRASRRGDTKMAPCDAAHRLMSI